MRLKTPEAIRTLQRKLYCKAKAEPNFRFYQLYDKIWRADILAHAYALSRSNRGAPGVDGMTFEQLESQGVEVWLQGLQEELKGKRYRPEPVRRVMIAKVGGGERPLGLPTIKDRVIQTAAKLVLEPIFEADMDDGAYGYRPKRSAADAVKKVHAALIEGYTEVVDADLSKYFDKIPHDDLMRSIALRIVDGSVLSLLKSWLQVPVQGDDLRMSGGKGNRLGTPQGGVISPLLANRYMNRFLRYWRQCDGERRFSAKLVNYADDFVILSKGKAQQALAWTQGAMTRLKLEINETKTSIKNARAEQFDFLGYRFGLMHNVRRQGRRYLGARASDKSMQKLKDTVGELLHHRQSGPWSEIRDHLNRTLSGWRNYFHYGSVFHYGSGRKSYTAINHHVSTKVRASCGLGRTSNSNDLQRRHKVPSRGTRQFSYRVIFDDYGVWKMTSR